MDSVLLLCCSWKLVFLLSVEGLLPCLSLLGELSDEMPALVIALLIVPISALRLKTACVAFEISKDSDFGDLDSWFFVGLSRSCAAAPLYSRFVL